MRVNSTDLSAEVDGVKYKWMGGFGAVLISYENGLKQGDLRAIGDTIFKVFSVTKNFLRKDTVGWQPVEDVDVQWIRDFKLEFLGISLVDHKEKVKELAEMWRQRESV